ncbi:RNA polymerase sigma factor [Ktedonobacter racemifer]|uniref:RNA polymerase, sigma-24 subunit, ECF subfamily n=1 Tax=Ktedonobacter racemifer DSM 44963 TaxID=485913 RepID=D6TH62_KTERA|nr:sigma-70 family RNA polymerase sigma factor [Ktedonobacter racemifer]EFH90804.1 RNA polymerase, sigma-24 subunit, ECF subfamily [Ktedonobacter racemifer DSM 44963]
MNILLVLPSLFQPSIELDEEKKREVELIEAAKANPEAFAPLYERYAYQVYCYTRTHVHSEEDAADLTQQTFLHALRALPRYQLRGIPFIAWLFRIALYTIRQKQRKERGTVSWDLLPEILHSKDELGPEGALLAQERLKRVEDLLVRLKHSQREMLALRFAAGLRSSEIAAVLGKSQAAVKKQLSRILHTLKEGYRQDEEI